MTQDLLLAWLGAASNIAAVLGVPLALLVYVTENRRRRREREYGTYDALDEKYGDYLKMVVENPELELFYSPPAPGALPKTSYSAGEVASFELLIGIYERSFLMYSDESSDIKRYQWEGWSRSIRSLVGYPDFPSLWRMVGSEFDTRFKGYVEKELRSRTGRTSKTQ